MVLENVAPFQTEYTSRNLFVHLWPYSCRSCSDVFLPLRGHVIVRCSEPGTNPVAVKYTYVVLLCRPVTQACVVSSLPSFRLLDSAQLFFACVHKRTSPSKRQDWRKVERNSDGNKRDRERRYESEIGASSDRGRGNGIQRNKKRWVGGADSCRQKTREMSDVFKNYRALFSFP